MKYCNMFIERYEPRRTGLATGIFSFLLVVTFMAAVSWLAGLLFIKPLLMLKPVAGFAACWINAAILMGLVVSVRFTRKRKRERRAVRIARQMDPRRLFETAVENGWNATESNGKGC